MTNTVRKGSGPAMKTDYSRPFQQFPTTFLLFFKLRFHSPFTVKYENLDKH